MRNQTKLFGLLLAPALALCACGQDAPASSAVSAPASAPVQSEAEFADSSAWVSAQSAPAGPFADPVGAAAQTSGQLIYTANFDFAIDNGNAESGWFITSWMSKGYGTKIYAVCPATGQLIVGEEGAPVILCQQALIRFVWKDADGAETDAYTVYTLDGEPQTYTLFAEIYGLDGQLQEEREVTSLTQTADDPYFSVVYPAMQSFAEEYNGSLSGQVSPLTVKDDGGDAVVCSADGSELIRLPGTPADMAFAYISADGHYVSVYRPDSDQTEFYLF